MDTSAAVVPAGGMGLAEAAVTYAAAGLPVFPCAVDGKRPLTRHGLTDASTGADQITRWWQRWPAANIGLVTGGAGFDVLDIDVHPSGSGFAALEQLRRAGLVDGWVHQVRTPSGGRHLYFPAVPSRPQPSWSLPGRHVDFRGTGGYVIVPPSAVVNGNGDRGHYELVALGGKSRPVDAAAIRALIAPRQSPRPPRPTLPLDAAGSDRLAGWLAAQREGNRNQALFWAACRHAEAGTPQYHARQALSDAAGRTGLSAREIQTTIASAYRRVASRDPAADMSVSADLPRGL